jgi:hypothetical protein
MNVLHLSDTSLSGSPVRISKLLNRYSEKTVSRQIVWQEKVGYRSFEMDMFGPILPMEELRFWIYEWPDVIHYHNRYARQMVFQKLRDTPPKIPSVIQIHSPRREDEYFEDEARSGIPLAIVAQYHPREWPELSFVVPNVVDIFDPTYIGRQDPEASKPMVSFAPSNSNMKLWNNKGYAETHPVLQDLKRHGLIHYNLVTQQPHNITMAMKRDAHIGIDEIVTGSYHMSSLEYLALGAVCFAKLDEQCERVLKDLTGSANLPWTHAEPKSLKRIITEIVRSKSWREKGSEARAWMETFWSPEVLVKHYEDMYSKL